VQDIEDEMLAALSRADRDQFRHDLESCYSSLNGSESKARH
jgi:hypothetical protein